MTVKVDAGLIVVTRELTVRVATMDLQDGMVVTLGLHDDIVGLIVLVIVLVLVFVGQILHRGIQ